MMMTTATMMMMIIPVMILIFICILILTINIIIIIITIDYIDPGGWLLCNHHNNYDYYVTMIIISWRKDQVPRLFHQRLDQLWSAGTSPWGDGDRYGIWHGMPRAIFGPYQYIYIYIFRAPSHQFLKSVWLFFRLWYLRQIKRKMVLIWYKDDMTYSTIVFSLQVHI